MFTGLIEEVGTVVRVVRRPEGAHLVVKAERVLEGTRIGDSIAVSGACLTVVQMGGGAFTVDCMAETLERSTLGELRAGGRVNLERALALGERLGGHLVLGHVDAVGTVLSVAIRGIAWELRVSLPPELGGYVAPKGSIAVDGISLTVTDVTAGDFGLGIIPHTLKVTTLGAVAAGDRVNLEADVLARYVRQALLTGATPAEEGAAAQGELPPRGRGRGLTEEDLRKRGFMD